MTKASGIYVIRNRSRGYFYLGSAEYLSRRMWQHFAALRRGDHHNQRLQRAWSRYGQGSFEWIVVALVDGDALRETEQRLLNALIDSPLCYNTARDVRVAEMTPEKRAKIGRGNRGRQLSPEWRKKIGDAQRGKPDTRSQEDVQRSIEAMNRLKPKNHSEATRQKMSETHKERFRANPNVSPSYSEEARRKISESQQKRLRANPELAAAGVRRMQQVNKGRPHSPEHTARQVAAANLTRARKKAERGGTQVNLPIAREEEES